MAESDPKKIRPFGQTPDRRHLDPEEDPLVELARIVSEDSGFYGARADRPKRQREPAADRNAYSANLESELLQELESSFSRSTPPRVPPREPHQQRPSAPPPADDSDDLLRSIERQLGEFERRAQATRSPSPIPVEPTQPAWQTRYEPPEPEDHELPPGADAAEAGRRSDLPDRRAAEARERIASVRPPELQQDRVLDPSAGAPESRVDPRIGRLFAGSRDRALEEEPQARSRLPLRRRDSPAQTQEDHGLTPVGSPMGVGMASGWNQISDEDGYAASPRSDRDWRSPEHDSPSDMRPALTAYDETPGAGYAVRNEPARREVVHEETAYSEDLQPSYADPTFGGHWQDSGGAEQDGSYDEPRGADASAGSLGEERGSERRRSRAGLIAASAVLGVVVIGGAAAMYMRTAEEGPSGPPPVIAAAEGNVKVAPEPPPAAEAETVGEAVYNRVAGDAPPAEEQVVDGAEEPREISRIVLPPPQENSDQALVRPVGEEDAAGGEAGGEVAATDPNLGPRRVRTYVVRPDGTIAETSGTGAESAPTPPPAEEQQVAAVAVPDAEPMVPVRVPTTEIDGRPQAESAQPERSPDAAPAAPPPQVAAAEPAVAPPEARPEPAAPAAAEPIAAPPPPTTTAAAAAPAAAPPAAAPAADGFVVQISSQRSMADAQSSWTSAQRRYSSVLGNMEPNIQQADLGAKGTFYRVRVGPWPSRGEAVQVCERLRAAGGDCIVTR